MKHKWKKQEKNIYMPKQDPEKLVVPKYKFFTLTGKGNPNDEAFSEAVGVLYSLSYGIKMMLKKGMTPPDYSDYTVYPLEGVWDLDDEAKKSGVLDKNHFIYKIMIRQPNFVTTELVNKIVEQLKIKKPHALLNKVQFEEIEDGLCVQMMHIGPYDDEYKSFEKINKYYLENNLERKSLTHREIYITDARKSAPEKMKTVLRCLVQ